MTLNQALLNTSAPTIGFSYQETKRQILGDALYDEKKGSSYLDPLYSDKISTEKLKRLAKRVKERRMKSNEQQSK